MAEESGVKIQKLSEKALQKSGKDITLVLKLSPYSKGTYSTYENSGIFEVYLDPAECFDPKQDVSTLNKKVYHLIRHEIGHKKNDIVEAYADYRHEIAEKTGFISNPEITLDSDIEATIEDIQIDVTRALKDSSFLEGFIYNNTVSMNLDALKISEMSLQKDDGDYKISPCTETQFTQLLLRITRRAVIAGVILNRMQLDSEKKRYLTNMKNQLDQYLHNVLLRYPDLQSSLNQFVRISKYIANNPELSGSKNVKNDLKESMKGLRSGISFNGESSDVVGLTKGPLKQLKEGKVSERDFPLSQPMINQLKRTEIVEY